MRRVTKFIVAVGIGAAVALSLYFVVELQSGGPANVTPKHPVWIEAKWPFLMDQWGGG